MVSISLVSTIIFGLSFCIFYYLLVSAITKQWVIIRKKKLLYYVSLFCVFGISGEIVVNTLWQLTFDAPLWQYRLYPTNSGHISYFFPLIWGSLGFYKYINDTVWHRFKENQIIKPGLIMGAETILIEIIYNGAFLLLFGEYIFYYLPKNLGPLSHLSCLQVLPFYFMVGLVLTRLIHQQNKTGYNKDIIFTVGFFWMTIFALLLV